MAVERGRVEVATTAPAAAGQLGVRVGVDLMAVRDVEDAVARLGERYLTRLFTEHERACSEGPAGVVPESLAARFAAKEAVLKVLRPSGSRPEWRDIEVRRNADGSCDVELHGAAADLAAARGVDQVSLSLSHEAGIAVAVAVGTCPADGSPEDPSATRTPIRS